MQNLSQLCIVMRGAGEMATGVAFRLYHSGFRRIVLLEQESPLAVRRTVCFSEAVYHDRMTVEDVEAKLVRSVGDCPPLWSSGTVPVLVDPQGHSLAALHPDVLIEATLAKCNVGVTLGDAPLVIGVGPGFTVGVDVHAIIESNRGPCLGRVLHGGSAEPNTGIPGSVNGLSVERVLRAPCGGVFRTALDIGDRIEQNAIVAHVHATGAASDAQPIRAAIGGIIRGLLPDNTVVTAGVKTGDIEPRNGISCHAISEKALAIGGGVLEAILGRYNN